MSLAICTCGHEAYDHLPPKSTHRDDCRVCWCTKYTQKLLPHTLPRIDYTSLGRRASLIELILERIEREGCPQGLNVIGKELRWMGRRSATHAKLVNSVRAEMRLLNSRIDEISPGIYGHANRIVPAGWNQYRDRRMLPCFYLRHPPSIRWEEVNLPDNLLPSPQK